MIKVAIHNRAGSFSERWIRFCEKNKIQVKLVDAYSSSITEDLKDVDIFFWHHSHSHHKDIIFAKSLLFSLEQTGTKVFPNFNTAWHFDDKIGQKYLLEAIDARLVPSYVFYHKSEP